jgi:cold shock CspA family protein
MVTTTCNIIKISAFTRRLDKQYAFPQKDFLDQNDALDEALKEACKNIFGYSLYDIEYNNLIRILREKSPDYPRDEAERLANENGFDITGHLNDWKSFTILILAKYSGLLMSPIDALEYGLKNDALAFQRERARSGERKKGTIEWYNHERGFGFIRADKFDIKDAHKIVIFRHEIELAGLGDSLKYKRVSFEVEEGKKGPKAVRVQEIFPPRRTIVEQMYGYKFSFP